MTKTAPTDNITRKRLTFLEKTAVHDAMKGVAFIAHGTEVEYPEGISDQTIADTALPNYQGNRLQVVQAHRNEHFGKLWNGGRTPSPRKADKLKLEDRIIRLEALVNDLLTWQMGTKNSNEREASFKRLLEAYGELLSNG